jgi:hypothetical protein
MSSETRHIPEFAPPLLILGAIGIYRIYSLIQYRLLKFSYTVMCTITIISIPFIYKNDIREHNVTSRLVEQTLAEASTYPSDELFITNTTLFIDAFAFDLTTTPVLTVGKDRIKNSCPDNKHCTMVLYKNNTRGSQFKPENLPGCEKSLVSYEASVLLCSMDKIDSIPDVFFERPEFEIANNVIHPLFEND